MVQLTKELIERLQAQGVECLLPPGSGLPNDSVFEPPCSVKWMNALHKLKLGAFSYAVRGYFLNVEIGRYTSIGEDVQIGRADHPTSWLSTSPAFYLKSLFNVGNDFSSGTHYHRFEPKLPPGHQATQHKLTRIGHDVYIGHGAFIRPGVTIGHGAIIAAHAVIVKDVPPYAVVAGNPGVIKKFRIQSELIERMLAVEWWRFAPWQLDGLDITNPERALPLLERVCPKLEPYAPISISLEDLLSTAQ